MKKKRGYKRWTAEEIAWLSINQDKGNIHLQKVLDRTIPSIESMKRNIRNLKQEVDPVLSATVRFTKPQYKAWKDNSEAIQKDYITHVTAEREASAKEIEKDPPFGECCIQTPVYRTVEEQKALEEQWAANKDKHSPHLSNGIEYPIGAANPHVMHEPVEPEFVESSQPSCLGDREKELGINNGGLTSWQEMGIATGILVLLIVFLMLILNS